MAADLERLSARGFGRPCRARIAPGVAAPIHYRTERPGRGEIEDEGHQPGTESGLGSDAPGHCSLARFTGDAPFSFGPRGIWFEVGVYRLLAAPEAMWGGAKLFCMPNPLPTRSEAIRAFVEWANANPSRMSKTPTGAFAEFLSQRYPCANAR